MLAEAVLHSDKQTLVQGDCLRAELLPCRLHLDKANSPLAELKSELLQSLRLLGDLNVLI